MSRLLDLLETSDCLEQVSDVMRRLSLECPNMSSIDLYVAGEALADLITRCECTVAYDPGSYHAIAEMGRFILEALRRVRALKADVMHREMDRVAVGGD